MPTSPRGTLASLQIRAIGRRDAGHAAVRAGLRAIATTGVVVLALSALAVPSGAATVTGWADWTSLSGATGAWSTTVTSTAAGLGPVSMTSTSLGGASVGVIGGATRWLGPSTPPGTLHGSSADRPYVNLAHATGGTASVTTYTFARPAPAGSWSLVLGDVDLERLTISATAPDGSPLTAAQLGWVGAFNYCAGSGAAEPSCTGADAPTVSTTATTVALAGLGANTDGAAGWLRPTTAVTSLTVTSERLPSATGTQLYQTWFATIARDVTGTVSRSDVPSTPVADATVTLLGPDGAPVATRVTAPDGTYAFTGVAAGAGHTVQVAPPAGLLVSGPATAAVDLSTSDATADFTVRAPVAVTAVGTVLDPGGTPVPGVGVTLLDTAGASIGATWGADGAWTAGPLGVGTWTVSLDVPSGYVVVTGPAPLVVAPGDEGTRTLVPAIVRAVVPVSATGTVTSDAGRPLAGVPVTLTGPAGATATTTTGADGTWTAGPLSPGTWTASVTPPAGWLVASTPVAFEVAAGDEGPRVVGATVLREREPVVVTGVVRSQTGPVAGAVITLTNGPETVTATSAADGTWSAPLAPGVWTITVTAPDGMTVLSAPQTLRLAPDSEGVTELAAVVLAATGTATLPVTGAEPGPATGLATALVVVGLGLVLAARSAGRRADARRG